MASNLLTKTKSDILGTINETTFQAAYKDQFFDDEIRLVDYILVYMKDNTDRRRNDFFNHLSQWGLEIEEEESVIEPNLVFVKVHTPMNKLSEYAEKYDISLKKFEDPYHRRVPPKFKCFRNELTAQDNTSPNYYRAEETFSGNQPTTYLRNERILITYNVLKRISYGPYKIREVGIHHLIQQNVLVAAYPLHDGTSLWSSDAEEPLNDRQLLRKFWSSPTNFFKAQPLDVIERYFGENIAIYFAWMSFYNKMLIVLIFAGIVILILNYLTRKALTPIRMENIMSSDDLVCPYCTACTATPLRDFYLMFGVMEFTESYIMYPYAVLLSLWAALYLIFWRRKEAILACRWNILRSDLNENDVRPEFETIAKLKRNAGFGELKLYIPLYIKCFRLTLSLTAVLFMSFVLLYIHYFILTMRYNLRKWLAPTKYLLLLVAILHMIIILLLRRAYEPIVIWLVNFELPKTQTSFDNSYIWKMFLLSFINNYSLCIYLLFKGRFFTHPNDPNMYSPHRTAPLLVDQCHPAGCSMELIITVFILITFLPLLHQTWSYLYMTLFVWCKRKQRGPNKHVRIPRWEKDYALLNYKEVIKLYEGMVAQFGLMTMFSYAIPFAPIIVLINNVIKIHINAHAMVVHMKRPQARRTASIEAWLPVMQLLTFLSIFTNAYCMSFLSNIIPIYIYYSKIEKNASLPRFERTILSEYKINLNHWPNAGVPNGTICLYPGTRYGPDSEEPYKEHSDAVTSSSRQLNMIIYENLVILLALLISYFIPTETESEKIHMRRASKLQRSSLSSKQVRNLKI